jgi:hypothetical protein
MQTAMGKVQVMNTSLKAEIEIKPSILDSFYEDVFENRPNTRLLVDVNCTPPSKKAMEGALVIFTTVYAKPTELTGKTITIDLFDQTPLTKFLI